MVSLARKNLLHDRLRFVITVAGVAFAVTLVLMQVGLFMGLLAKATVTIERAGADLWVTSRQTPNIDFAHTFPETTVLRVRGVPGVARADNLLVQFMNIQLPSGAEEGCLVYALEDFSAWNLPWDVEQGDPRELRRGAFMLMDRSAERRFGPFVSTGLGMNMGLTVFLGVLVGVVVVAQTLYTSAVEHLKEFGTVKAIGGSNWDIYRILGEQALIAAVVGFSLGTALSFALRPLLAWLHLATWSSPGFLALVFGGTLLMCVGAAMLSFRRVADIDPALVFRA